MIHCALLGSIERFLSVFIEHTGGRFPVWVAPEQIRFITLNQEDNTVAYAQKTLMDARQLGLRCTVDNSNESVGKKIRAAELMKVPYTIVIGSKEIESGAVVRTETLSFDEFFKSVAHEAKSRVSKSTI
jgi:threonyl-tRNA synthetase